MVCSSNLEVLSNVTALSSTVIEEDNGGSGDILPVLKTYLLQMIISILFILMLIQMLLLVVEDFRIWFRLFNYFWPISIKCY